MVVVLPAPFGPSNANTVPVGTARSSPESTSVRPKRLRSPRASMASVMACSFDGFWSAYAANCLCSALLFK